MLEEELHKHPDIDTLVAVDDHILKLLHMVVQSRTLFSEHPVILSGFGTIDDVLATETIDIYQKQDPTMLGEVAIDHLLDMINHRSLAITQIIRIPSVLTFGKSAI
jgi:acyl-CoA hydrolase